MPRQQTPPGSISSHKTNFTLSIYEKFAAKSKSTEFGMGRNQTPPPSITSYKTENSTAEFSWPGGGRPARAQLRGTARSITPPPSISSYRAKVTNDSMTFRGSSGLPSRGAGRSITPPRSISSHRATITNESMGMSHAQAVQRETSDAHRSPMRARRPSFLRRSMIRSKDDTSASPRLRLALLLLPARWHQHRHRYLLLLCRRRTHPYRTQRWLPPLRSLRRPSALPTARLLTGWRHCAQP